jgi:Tol biopolymer transport system component
MIGKTISHYQILEPLGGGGMGMVYRAQDTRLNRTVALKFLSPELIRDSKAKQRFVNEAQAASALDHPNICTIFEIDETKDERMFIVMALYEGQTLDRKIAKGPLELDEAISIAVQVAQGLVRAHQVGIVHRDIKPANIMITEDGLVKILDLGLAKVSGQRSLTQPGTVMGTVAYMSPEQASGQDVDRRTDIWSLGVVLYEMIAGQLPFKGDHDHAVSRAILDSTPTPLTSLRTGVPPELEHIVVRALEKSPRDRHQTSEDFLSELQRFRRDSDSLPPTMTRRILTTAVPVRRARIPWSWIIAGGVVLIGLLAWLAPRLIDPRSSMLAIAHTTPLTTAPGLEEEPTWSPDCTRIAYASDQGGDLDIWVRQARAGQPLNLTPGSKGYDGMPVWSPDGQWIAFVSERDGGGIFVMPALGGAPRRVMPFAFVASSRVGYVPTLSWSPDRTKLAYASQNGLHVVSSEGGIPVNIPLPVDQPAFSYSRPAWSPDGQRIACAVLTGAGTTVSTIWTVGADGEDPIPITDGQSFDHCPNWSGDGKRLFFVSDRSGSGDIWWMPIGHRGQGIGPARSLTAGLGVGSFSLSRDAKTLAYSKVTERVNIWSISIRSERALTLDEARAVTEENHLIEFVTLSPDKEWIAFDSNRSGNQDIWLMRTDGSDLRQFTTNRAHDWYPRWAPDGKQIVFQSLRSGNRDIYKKPVVGGAATPITRNTADDMFPIWSPDGEEIAFFSNRTGARNLWVVSSGGGEPRELTRQSAALPLWSHDGKRLVFSSDYTGSVELFLVPAEGGETVQLTHGEWAILLPGFWSRDGQTIYAYGEGGPGGHGANLWAISLVDGSSRPLLDLRGSSKWPNWGLSGDEDMLYFTLRERRGDLWLAELGTE